MESVKLSGGWRKPPPPTFLFFATGGAGLTKAATGKNLSKKVVNQNDQHGIPNATRLSKTAQRREFLFLARRINFPGTQAHTGKEQHYRQKKEKLLPNNDPLPFRG